MYGKYSMYSPYYKINDAIFTSKRMSNCSISIKRIFNKLKNLLVASTNWKFRPKVKYNRIIEVKWSKHGQIDFRDLKVESDHNLWSEINLSSTSSKLEDL